MYCSCLSRRPTTKGAFGAIAYNDSVGSWTGRSLSALRRRGRKVRTPQSSVPDNVREGGFKPVRRKVPQKTYRPGNGVRVKRCGKSAPPPQKCGGQGKPHTEQ